MVINNINGGFEIINDIAINNFASGEYISITKFPDKIRLFNKIYETSEWYDLYPNQITSINGLTTGYETVDLLEKKIISDLLNKDKDFFLEVSKGNIPKHYRVNKSGINLDIDTATDPEDIISNGNTFTPPTVARIHNIVSSDANDTNLGTGARTITIQGLDGNYNYATETIILNGISNVPTVNSYIIIDYMAVLTSGSASHNLGTITATAQTDATVTTEIPIGYNQNQMAVFQIRNGYKGYLNSYYASMNQATANSTAVIHLMTKTDTGSWLVRRVMFLNNAGNNSVSQEIKPPLQLLPKTLIKLRIFEATNNNTMVSGGFDLTLVQD